MLVGWMSLCVGLLHLVAECRVSVDESQDVTVDAAAWGQLGKDGRLHLLLPLLDDHLTGLPLPQHLLVALADLCINLHRKKKDNHTPQRQIQMVCVHVCMSAVPGPCPFCPCRTCSVPAGKARPPSWCRAALHHNTPAVAAPAPYSSTHTETGEYKPKVE